MEKVCSRPRKKSVLRCCDIRCYTMSKKRLKNGVQGVFSCSKEIAKPIVNANRGVIALVNGLHNDVFILHDTLPAKFFLAFVSFTKLGFA